VTGVRSLIGHIFGPTAIEATCYWNQQAIDAIEDTAKRTSTITQTTRETTYLFQSISEMHFLLRARLISLTILLVSNILALCWWTKNNRPLMIGLITIVYVRCTTQRRQMYLVM